MSRVDTVRMLVADERRGRSRPEILEVLASGHPPAFATDSRERIVFWNTGAAELLGRRADDAMGRRCFEVLGGRDVFGNRFCRPSCPVLTTLREGEPVCPFEFEVTSPDGASTLYNVTLLKIPSFRADLFTLVHILQPIDEPARLARALTRLNPGEAAESLRGAASAVAATPPPAPENLTPREREVLQCIAAGLPNKEVAARLNLSVATVRNHIHNVLDKLGVHSKLEAASLAFRKGWIQQPEAN